MRVIINYNELIITVSITKGEQEVCDIVEGDLIDNK